MRGCLGASTLFASAADCLETRCWVPIVAGVKVRLLGLATAGWPVMPLRRLRDAMQVTVARHCAKVSLAVSLDVVQRLLSTGPRTEQL